MNANNSYAERNSGVNIGEQLFEEYCNNKKLFIRKLGFNEKDDPIPNFYSLSPFIRNIPDYLVIGNKGPKLVNVKGTANFKTNEVSMIPQFIEWFNTKDCPLIYAFCFKGHNTPYFRTPDQVIELYQKAVDKKWNDGVKYRTLHLE
jgi:hypothetical protein